MIVSTLLVLLAWSATAQAERVHPFLFITGADAERARTAAGENPTFAALAAELISRATTNRVEALPPLERAWWDSIKDQPWKQTYPPIFHHTFVVPAKWGDLVRDCAQASLLSPSSPAAEKGRRALLALSDYTFEFDHYDVGMNYTIWAMAALEAYDILYAGFTAAERARMEAFFERYLKALQKNDLYWTEHEPGGELNNHYAWHKLGLCMIGMFYGRPELVENALRGPKGVEHMLSTGFKDDGLWLEGSIPYQFAETAPLVIMARLLENAGSPEGLFNYRTANGRTLNQSYDALLPLLFPDRTLPPIGDAYARRIPLGESFDWEVLYRQCRAPGYAWLITERGKRSAQALFLGVPKLAAAPAPAQHSRVWPEMGYVALRSNEGTQYWSGHGWSLFATFSGQSVHHHADKLSFMLFAENHLWLPDCEARTSAEHAFSSTVQATLNRTTLCHNTLLVDGQSQRFPGQRLELLEVSTNSAVKRVTIGDLQGRLYDGVRQLRTFVVGKDFVLDFFQAASAAPHEFTWVTHVDGEPGPSSLEATNSIALPTAAPWSWLRAARSARTDGRLWECFSSGKHTLRMDVLTDGPAELVQCGFPRDDSSTPATLPMRLLKRQGSNVWFLAAYALPGKAKTRVELAVEPAGAKELRIVLRRGRATAQYAVPRLQ